MDIEKLVGASFEHFSFDELEKHKWSVTKTNPKTNYVYVERDNNGGKIGQWIPAGWIEHLTASDKLRLKIDSLRKSRDYFREERDEINKILVRNNISAKENSDALLSELDFCKMEVDILEKDVTFWRSFTLYSLLASVVLLSAFAATAWKLFDF